MPTRVRIAHVRRAHGLRGELLVRPLGDRVHLLFAPGRLLYSDPSEGPPLRLRAARPAADGWLLLIEGVEDRNAADGWRERDLWVARDEFEALGDVSRPLDDFIGLRVELADGTPIGTVSNYYELPQGPMLEVTREQDELLFPLHDDFVKSVDRERGVLVVEPPAGLFD